MKRIHSLEEVLTLSFTKCYSFDLYCTFSYSSSSFYIHEQLLPFFLLGVRAVSLGRTDLCKVFYPFVPALKRLLSMTAFFCGNRIPLPKQQVLPTNSLSLWSTWRSWAENQYRHFKTQETLFSYFNVTDTVFQALQG